MLPSVPYKEGTVLQWKSNIWHEFTEKYECCVLHHRSEKKKKEVTELGFINDFFESLTNISGSLQK